VIRMSGSRALENENKAFVRHWFEEVWNQGREDLIDQFSTPEVPATGLGEGSHQTRSREVFKAFYRTLRGAFPDIHVTIEDTIAEGDKVVVRLSVQGTHTGNSLAPATGRNVTFAAVVIARIADGRIAEAWNSIDQLGILKQVGALPSDSGPDRFLTPRG